MSVEIKCRVNGRPINAKGRNSGRTHRMLREAVLCSIREKADAPVVVYFDTENHALGAKSYVEYIAAELGLAYEDRTGAWGDARVSTGGRDIILRGMQSPPKHGVFFDHFVQQLCKQPWVGGDT